MDDDKRLDRWTKEIPWIGQYVLDENGNAVRAKGLLSWGEWMEEHKADCRVGFDEIGNATVSTVFLGLDSGPGMMCWAGKIPPPDYKPRLWETMVFGGPYNLHQMRYTSHADAVKGHGQIVQMLTS